MTGRWSLLDRRVRSVAAVSARFGLRPNAGAKSDWTLVGCVRSVLTYADVGRTEESPCDRTLGESGRAGPDVSGHEKSSMDAYWKRPDAGVQRPVIT